MGKMFENRFPLTLFLIILFLAVIPTTAFYAQQTANQGSAAVSAEEHWFGADATVESVGAQLKAFDPSITVAVTDQDGTPRTGGLLEEGDFVMMYNASGKLLKEFVNINPDSQRSSSSDSVPPASSQPEDSASSSEQASSQSQPESSVPSDSPSGSESSSASNPGSSASSGQSSASGVSSEPNPGSSASSGQSSGSGVSSGPADGFLSGGEDYFDFSTPVSVEELEDQLLDEGVPDSRLTVKSYNGNTRLSGSVCTGDVLTVENPDGTVQNRVTAVVAGDLTRRGTPDEASCRALYNYLAGSGTLRADLRRAADLNRDGAVTTSDLLKLKKMISGED
ncbi:dockerin type I domain-containing protein [Caproicibacter sp.]|uniref:dockerin type I domain-containing protein n=1 Tax=Caproicibacter sp. TaxID=2814884 RepID=UPI003989FE8A